MPAMPTSSWSPSATIAAINARLNTCSQYWFVCTNGRAARQASRISRSASGLMVGRSYLSSGAAEQAHGREQQDGDQDHHADRVLVRGRDDHAGEGLDETEHEPADHCAHHAAEPAQRGGDEGFYPGDESHVE